VSVDLKCVFTQICCFVCTLSLVCEPMNPVRTLLHYIFIFSLMLSFHIRTGLPKDLFLSGSLTIIFYLFLICHACCLPPPLTLPLVNNGRYTRTRRMITVAVNRQCPLERWDHVFETHSKHGCLYAFILCLCCCCCVCR
jgi:hypothetical protein